MLTIFLCVLLVFFAFYMICFAGQFPGGVNADINDQLAQALGETGYNDWHPVLHTLLFMTIPLKIVNHYGFIIFLQLLYLCLAFTYLLFVLYQNGGSRFFLAGLCLYILINPFLFTYSVYAMKDIAMMIFAIVLVSYYIQIICTKGSWLCKKRNVFLFAAAVILCSYMRHNAILFTAPLVLITMIYLLHFRHRKSCIAILLSIALLFMCVKGLYACLDVQQPWYRKLEKIGVPLSVWSNVIYSNPSALPEETREFIYQLIPADLEEMYSVDAGFNSIKSMDLVDYGSIDAISYRDVLKVTWQCFQYAPQETLEALAKLCDIVWEVDVPVSPMDVSIIDNDYGVQSQPVSGASVFVSQLKMLFGSGLLGTLLGSIGFELLIFVILGAVFFSRNRMAVLHLIPFFCYDFGTMLLLTGRDYRFFLFNIPLWIPVIFLMFKDNLEFKCKSPSL
ncbi:MAG: hypothetical protein LUC90_07025 [Lachnospiraceae bacterium]|nr:hypothetical protein [Lachnospiraceae bacterium]